MDANITDVAALRTFCRDLENVQEKYSALYHRASAYVEADIAEADRVVATLQRREDQAMADYRRARSAYESYRNADHKDEEGNDTTDYSHLQDLEHRMEELHDLWQQAIQTTEEGHSLRRSLKSVLYEWRDALRTSEEHVTSMTPEAIMRIRHAAQIIEEYSERKI